MIASGYSFKLLSKGRATHKHTDPELKTEVRQIDDTEIDSKKRSFLKMAGVVGAGALAVSLIPKKAEALVFGSTPTSNTVGVKDSNNKRIDPAQETGGNLATLAGKDFATQTTLATVAKESGGNLGTVATNTGNIATNTSALGNLRFDGSNNLKVTGISGGGGTGVDPVGIKDTTATPINPASEESITYLRRMVKLMESQATVDAGNRQRISLDTIPAGVTLPTVTTVGTVSAITAGTITTVGTVSTITGGTITTITNAVPVGNVATIGGLGDQMFQDPARNAFANGIRQNLVWA
jgi:hypothetical protein